MPSERFPQCGVGPVLGCAHDDAEGRSKQLATLAVAARNLLCSDEVQRALEGAETEVAGKSEASAEVRTVAQVREAINYHERIPTELLRRKTEL